MRIVKTVAAFSALLLSICVANAQDYPTRPVTLIVPFAAGGPLDTLGRAMAAAMSDHLKQPVVVENVGGAGGTLGTARAAKATPDGYTLLLNNIGMALGPALYPNLGYDPQADFRSVGLVSFSATLLVTRRDFPAKNFQELIQVFKARGDKITAGTTGLGGPSDLAMMLLMRAINTKFTVVPYKGTSLALNDLISGQLDVMPEAALTAATHVAAGSIKAYAVFSSKRLASLPDIPTFEEEGMKDVQPSVWSGVFAPKGTSDAVVNRIVAALRHTLQDARFRRTIETLGDLIVEPERATPDALATHLKAELAKWTPLLKERAATEPR